MHCSLRVSLVVGALAVSTSVMGCSSQSAEPSPTAATQDCELVFGGDVPDSAKLPGGCGVLEPGVMSGEMGDVILSFAVSSPMIAALQIRIDLGKAPAVGVFTSETTSDWSAVAIANSEANCSYGAGAESVPQGSLTLSLDSVEIPAPGSRGVAHGSVDIQMYVHAPPGTTCGAADSESVTISF
jgi:hypothetical protein